MEKKIGPIEIHQYLLNNDKDQTVDLSTEWMVDIHDSKLNSPKEDWKVHSWNVVNKNNINEENSPSNKKKNGILL